MRPHPHDQFAEGASGPIGVFDSGFGGLSIFKRIRQLLPDYDYVYLGDNARSPYGNRSFEVVLDFTLDGVRALFELGCPLVVIACNTASAKALRSIQQGWLAEHCPDRRVLGVIRPTVEVLAEYTRTRSVALWATPGTVLSESFVLEIEKHAPGVRLVQQACPLLVPLVEAGELAGDGLRFFLRKYWDATLQQADGLDTLLLACTHYPLLRERIEEVIPPGVRILAQDEIVAPSLADYLRRHPEMAGRLTVGRSCRFLTTDQCEHFDRLAEIFMGHPIVSERMEIG
jgi:glutamate racemase